jgi:hypothetical protein
MFTIVDGVKRFLGYKRVGQEFLLDDDKNCQNMRLHDTVRPITFRPLTEAPHDTIAIGTDCGQVHPSNGNVEAGRGLRSCNDSRHPEIHKNRWWKLIHVRSNADYHEVHIMHHLSDASAPLYLGLIEGRPTLTVAPTAWYISTSAEIPPMSWRLPPLP